MEQENIFIRRHILMPLASVLLLLIGAAIAAFYWSELNQVQEMGQRGAHRIEKLFEREMVDRGQLLNVATQTLFENDAFLRAMMTDDTARMTSLATPLFRELQATQAVIRMELFTSDHTPVLQLGNPTHLGIPRGDLETHADEPAKPFSSSIELGDTQNGLALRTIVPWIRDGERIGDFEFDQATDAITSRVHEVLGVDFFILLDKNRLSRRAWEKRKQAIGHTPDWDRLPNRVVTEQTLPQLPIELQAHLNSARQDPNRTFFTSLDKQRYLGGSHPLYDSNGESVGEILYLRNVTNELNSALVAAGVVGLAFLCLGGGLFIFFYRYAGLIGERYTFASRLLKLQSVAQEASAVAIGITDANGILEYVNPTFAEITGYAREDLIGRDMKLLDAEDPLFGPQRRGWELARRGDAWSGRFRIIQRNENPCDVEVTISPVRDGGTEEINHFVVVGQDITEQLALEHNLRQVQKMEAVGQLAGGIAHDFNNLLTGILGYAELLKSEAGNPEIVQEAVDEIWSGAKRAADLTKQLLGFARRGKNRNVLIDLHELTPGVIRLIDPMLDKRISIIERFDAPRSIIRGDPSQIEQVILNLLLNAVDAIEAKARESGEGAKREIILRTHVDPRSEIRSPNVLGPGLDFFSIAISDTGCGMPPELQDRIFEPFFTTKDEGKGTGMGLAMVYGIVKAHEGWIEVDSHPGSGTTITVHFPLAEETALESEVITQSAPIYGTGQILIVDDEEPIRRLVSKILTSLGYTALTARNGREALEFFAKRNGAIDLILLDMVMPEMSGSECLIELKKIDPSVRVIITTGYGLNDVVQELIDAGAVGFVQKPFTAARISEEIARVLHLPRQDFDSRT